MEKKVSTKNVLFLMTMLVVIILSTTLLSGCWTAYYFNMMASAGYEFDKIIYTDNVEAYIAGRVQVEELEGVNIRFNGAKNGWYVLATSEANVYDMVFDTTLVVEDDGELGSGWVTLPEGMPLYSVGYSAQSVVLNFPSSYAFVGLDNSHIFSGKYGYYTPGGRTVCKNSECTCSWDDIDGHINRPSFTAKTTEGQMTNEEIEEYFAGYCVTCQYIMEVDNGDGTYTYGIGLTAGENTRYYNRGTWTTEPANISCGNPGGVFAHDGTWSRDLTSWLTTSDSQKPSAFRFNELVLDGYDFGWLYEYITNYDYNELYHNWEELYKPYDFSYMFSDLPVEKITIKNVKGLGTRATDLSGMFANCKNLRSIEFGNLFENCKPTNISKMFYNCPRLKNIDLSSLDTSRVTDMSELFAVGSSKMTAEERDQLIIDYINNVLIYEHPEMNKGEPYTIEDIFGEDLTSSAAAELYLMSAMEFGLNYPVTYFELSCVAFNNTGTLAEFINSAIANPTAIGLAQGSYSMKDIFDYMDNCAAAYGLYAIYDGNMYANKSREQYVEYIINNLLAPGAETPYTLQSFADSRAMSINETIIYISSYTGLEIPLTYDEFVDVYTEGEVQSIQALLELYNANPQDFEIIPQKEDGTNYTLIEFCSQIDALIEQLNIEEDLNLLLLTDKEMISYYQDNKHSPKGTLNLGGEGSLFVINNDTNIDKFFGDYCYFAVVITPDNIGDEILIPLQRDYEINNENAEESVVINTITANTVASVLNYYFVPVLNDSGNQDNVPDTPSEDTNDTSNNPSVGGDVNNDTSNNPSVGGNVNNNTANNDEGKMNLLVVSSISAGIVLAVLIVVGGLALIIKKTKKPTTIKDQKL